MTVTTEHTQTQMRSSVQRPDRTFGVDRYFEFLQREVNLTRESTVNWASAVAALSTAILVQTKAVRSIATERAEMTLDSWAGRPPLGHAGDQRRRNQQEAEPGPDDQSARQAQPATDVFDEVIELLVVDDVITATQQATTR